MGSADGNLADRRQPIYLRDGSSYRNRYYSMAQGKEKAR